MKVKIIRSFRRRKTIGAKEVNGVIHLLLPMDLTHEEESKYIRWAKDRVKARQRQRRLMEKNADGELEKRAQKVNEKYFEGELSWKQICYSVEQNNRLLGNCDTKNKTIRISDRLLRMPKFVQDYMIIHELAHLKIAGHGPEFWQLVNRYSKTERARGYLMAIGMKD